MTKQDGSFRLGKQAKPNKPVFVEQRISDRLLPTMVLGSTKINRESKILLPMVRQDLLAHRIPVIGSGDGDIPKLDTWSHLGQIVIDPKGDLAHSLWAMSKEHDQQLHEMYLEEFTHLLTSIKLKANVFLNRLKNTRFKLRDVVDHQTEIEVNEIEKEVKTYSSLKSLTVFLQTISPVALGSWSASKLLDFLSSIEDTVNNSSFEKEIPHLLSFFNGKYQEHELVTLIDFSKQNQDIKINPLNGDPIHDTDILKTAFIPANQGADEQEDAYFYHMKVTLLTAIIGVTDQIYGKHNTLRCIQRMLNEPSFGKDALHKYEEVIKSLGNGSGNDNVSFQVSFLKDYYKGLEFGKFKSAIADTTSGLRATINYVLSIPQLANVLCPNDGEYVLDFDTVLRYGQKIGISLKSITVDSAIEENIVRLISTMIKEACVQRPIGERIPVIVYLNDFDNYDQSEIRILFNEARSYRVSVVASVTSLNDVDRTSGKLLVENMKANMQNVVLLPGLTDTDQAYYQLILNEAKASVQSIPKTNSDGKNNLAVAKLVYFNNLKPAIPVILKPFPANYQSKIDKKIKNYYQR